MLRACRCQVQMSLLRPPSRRQASALQSISDLALLPRLSKQLALMLSTSRSGGLMLSLCCAANHDLFTLDS